MIKLLILIILIPLLFYLYLRWLERRSVWIPFSEWEALPSTIGLEYEDVKFTSSDGVKLSGWYVPAEEPVANLLFCHGNGGNISHRTESLRQFNSINLNVFIFDYRGYGKSEGELSEEGTYLDAQAAYQWLKERSPGLPMILFGRSLGASIAVDLATKVKADALICESGFTCVPDMGKLIFPWLPTEKICTIEYNTLAKIPHVKMPILIIHGPEDEVVPYSQGEKLYAAAPEPKSMIKLMGGHNDGFILSEEEYLREINRFVNQHILQGKTGKSENELIRP